MNGQHPKEKAQLREAHLRTIKRAWVNLRAIELDLQVLRSEFSPDLHQINRQLNELRERMEHERLDPESEKDGDPPQDDESPSSEA